MGIIIGILIVMFSIVSAFIAGGFLGFSDDEFHRELEDREQEEFLKEWAEKQRRKNARKKRQ